MQGHGERLKLVVLVRRRVALSERWRVWQIRGVRVLKRRLNSCGASC